MSDYENYLFQILPYLDFAANPKIGTTMIELLNTANISGGFFDEKDIEYLREHFGSLTVSDYANNSASGFTAISLNNAGKSIICYRGSDDPAQQPQDWTDNLLSSMTGTSIQVREAQDFFRKNASNYSDGTELYGHSKGGNLALSAFISDPSKVSKVRIFDEEPLDIWNMDWSKLTPEQLKKIIAVHCDGDLVSRIGDTPYEVLIAEFRYKDNLLGGFLLNAHDPRAIHFESGSLKVLDGYSNDPRNLLGNIIQNIARREQIEFRIGELLEDGVNEMVGALRTFDDIVNAIFHVKPIEQWLVMPFSGDWNAMQNATNGYLQAATFYEEAYKELARLSTTSEEYWSGESHKLYLIRVEEICNAFYDAEKITEKHVLLLAALECYCRSIVQWVIEMLRIIASIIGHIAVEAASMAANAAEGVAIGIVVGGILGPLGAVAGGALGGLVGSATTLPSLLAACAQLVNQCQNLGRNIDNVLGEMNHQLQDFPTVEVQLESLVVEMKRIERMGSGY